MRRACGRARRRRTGPGAARGLRSGRARWGYVTRSPGVGSVPRRPRTRGSRVPRARWWHLLPRPTRSRPSCPWRVLRAPMRPRQAAQHPSRSSRNAAQQSASPAPQAPQAVKKPWQSRWGSWASSFTKAIVSSGGTPPLAGSVALTCIRPAAVHVSQHRLQASSRAAGVSRAWKTSKFHGPTGLVVLEVPDTGTRPGAPGRRSAAACTRFSPASTTPAACRRPKASAPTSKDHHRLRQRGGRAPRGPLDSAPHVQVVAQAGRRGGRGSGREGAS